MLSIVAFKWKQRRHYSEFTAEHVNVLRRMIARHYQQPFKFFCVTDDADGLDPQVIPYPIWQDNAELKNIAIPDGPSCYRRLKLFAPNAGEIFGPRILCLDLDTVIVGDMSPIWDCEHDFIAWGDTTPRTHYNGSMFLMDAGCRSFVWTDFDPMSSPALAHQHGHRGSDQAWMSYRLGPKEARWGKEHGVYSWRVHIRPNHHALPDDARIVMFHGREKPWQEYCQNVGWIRESWR